jgi:hypothetical protein
MAALRWAEPFDGFCASNASNSAVSRCTFSSAPFQSPVAIMMLAM